MFVSFPIEIIAIIIAIYKSPWPKKQNDLLDDLEEDF